MKGAGGPFRSFEPCTDAEFYWWSAPGRVIGQGRDLDPVHVTSLSAKGLDAAILLGVRGDVMVWAKIVEPSELWIYGRSTVDFGPSWVIAALSWSELTRQAQISVWQRSRGPELTDEEVVLLSHETIQRVRIDDGSVITRNLGYRPGGLAVGARELAWFDETDQVWAMFDADSDPLAIFEPSEIARAEWVGHALVVNASRVFRVTPEQAVALDIPEAEDGGSRWMAGDREIVWLGTNGREHQMWWVSEDGFAPLELELYGRPRTMHASGGALLWTIEDQDGVRAYTSVPGSGLPLDAALLE